MGHYVLCVVLSVVGPQLIRPPGLPNKIPHGLDAILVRVCASIRYFPICLNQHQHQQHHHSCRHHHHTTNITSKTDTNNSTTNYTNNANNNNDSKSIHGLNKSPLVIVQGATRNLPQCGVRYEMAVAAAVSTQLKDACKLARMLMVSGRSQRR